MIKKIIIILQIIISTMLVAMPSKEKIKIIKNGNFYYEYKDIRGVVFNERKNTVIKKEVMEKIKKAEEVLYTIFFTENGNLIWNDAVEMTYEHIYLPIKITDSALLHFYINKILNSDDESPAIVNLANIKIEDLDTKALKEEYKKEHKNNTIAFYESGYNYIKNYFNKYKRQIQFYDNFNKVGINFFCGEFDYWLERNVEVFDGGPAFFKMSINLVTGDITLLYINGYA